MHISDLLVEIKLDIFSRLPAQSILNCKQVCKPWEILLSNPCFAGLHLEKQKQLVEQKDVHKVSLDFLLLIKFDNLHRENQLWLSMYDDYHFGYMPCKLINDLKPPVNINSIVGSVNGLICMSLSKTPCGMYDPVYICNPITREVVNLPRYIESGDGLIYSGFGYVDSINEYKVVRIYYGQNKSVGKVQVYTLGAGAGTGWRNKKDLTCSLNPSIPRGLFVNGAIHWLDEELNVVVFNLADEKFYQLPSPGQSRCHSFIVLGGFLCVVFCKDGGLVQLWLLKNENSGELGDKQLWRWTNEYSFVNKYMENFYPFSLTKRGEVLMWHKDAGFCLHLLHPKSQNIDRLASHFVVLDSFESVSHINSFVSLKAIGEDAKII